VGGGGGGGGVGEGGGGRRRREGRSRPTSASVEAGGRPAEAHEAPTEGGCHGSAPRTIEGGNQEKNQTGGDVRVDDGKGALAGGCRLRSPGRRAVAHDGRGCRQITPARGCGGSSGDVTEQRQSSRGRWPAPRPCARRRCLARAAVV